MLNNIKVRFRETIRNITTIPDNELNKLLEISHEKKIKKGEFFIKENVIPRDIGFVVKGLFRYFYVDKKGNEFTKGFFPENTFITSYSALIQNRESYFTIEALEDSTIIVFDYIKWKELSEKKLCWNKFLLFLVEKGYCIKEAREREFLLFSAEERYKSFLENYPGLEKRIKQHVIASFLGITPVALSRVRKKMKSLT
jgi:CRP-like cAMP-binding protein